MERIPDFVRAHTYAGLGSAAPGELLRHPARVVAGEADLRVLSRRAVGRLLLHREASPFSRGGLEARLLDSARVSVYDLDDALYSDIGEGPLYRRLAPKGPKAVRAARRADRVIAGNDVLAEWASRHNRDVVVIPSCVDPSSYDRKHDYDLGEQPRLGWVGSWSTEVHLVPITEALLRLHRDFDARITIIGITARGLGPLEEMIDRVPWSIEAQRRGIARFDVGLMPLTNTPYARGKCAYKLLQYMAAGVPAIGSPVGANERVLAAGGLPAATTPDSWYDAIRGFLEMTACRRAATGARAHKAVLEGYSFDAWRDSWRRATGLMA